MTIFEFRKGEETFSSVGKASNIEIQIINRIDLLKIIKIICFPRPEITGRMLKAFDFLPLSGLISENVKKILSTTGGDNLDCLLPCLRPTFVCHCCASTQKTIFLLGKISPAAADLFPFPPSFPSHSETTDTDDGGGRSGGTDKIQLRSFLLASSQKIGAL